MTKLSAIRLPEYWQPWLGGFIFFAYLFAVGLIHFEGQNAARRGERPLLTDFTSFYAASILIRDQPAADLYRPREMYRASLVAAQAAHGNSLSDAQAKTIGFHPWMYPPSYIAFALPWAYLPYTVAWFVWLLATALPYLLAMRKILADRSVWLLAFASPPVFFNIMYGQSGFLIAGLIGLGLVWLPTRPVFAGICIGLASVKPHFGLLIPFALICGAYWKTFWSAVATVVLTIVLSALAFGIDSWYGFIGSLFSSMRGFEAGAYNLAAMASVFGALHQAGLGISGAWKGQAMATFSAFAIAVWAWWRDPSRATRPGLEAAVLCLASLLAIPMVYLYDLMLLVPAIAWLWSDMRDHGHSKWELWILYLCTAGLIGLRELPIGPELGVMATASLLSVSVLRLATLRLR